MNDIKDVIEEIKARSDIKDIISDYIKLVPSGANFKGLCPFHGEKTPSFHVSTSKQMYKCFGCQEGGDVINFVMKIENLEFMDAVKLLAEKCGMEINTNINEEARLKIEKSKKYQNICTEAARFFFANLITQTNPGYTYLKNRGLDDKTIKKFGLGYSKDMWNSLYSYLNLKGYTDEELFDCGLIAYSKDNKIYDKFRNRVMFPIFDYRGNVIGFGGRVLDDSLPKYLNSPDTLIFNKRKNLYGLNFARKNIKDRTLILVEGYMDLISLFQAQITNVVATLGTALTEEQGKLIKRYADTVIISYDSDDAGIKATIRAIDILINLGINVKVLNLGDAKDPDEFIKKFGLEKFNEAIDLSISYIKYKIDNLQNNFNMNKDDEVVKFTKEASNILKSLKSAVEIDYYANYLSKKTNMSIEAIKREIYGKNYNNKYNKFSNKKEEKVIDKPKTILNGKQLVEETLIKIMLNDKNLRKNIISMLDEYKFLLKDSQEILKYIIKNQELDKITIDKIKSLNISEEYLKDLESISLEALNLTNSKIIEEIVKNIKRNDLEEEINTLLQTQINLEKSINDLPEDREVEKEIMEIAKKIINLKQKLHNL
jgi:DNA primase